MSSSEIPQEVSHVIQHLSIIAGIPSGSKLNSVEGTYADANSWIDSFWRWRNKESSENSLDYINKTITEAIRVAKKYNEWETQICSYIVSLEKAIINLMHVYRKEPGTLGRIEVIKLRITKQAFDAACKTNITNSLQSSLQTSLQSSMPIPIVNKLSKSLPEISNTNSSDETNKEIFDKIDINSFDSNLATPKSFPNKNKK